MSKTTGWYPQVKVDRRRVGAVGCGGGVLLTETVVKSGLDTALREGLARFGKPLARHAPGKVVLDLALTLALGGDCLADVARLRSEPGLYGLVASDATISRMISRLAAKSESALKAIDKARGKVRASVWAMAGNDSPFRGSSADNPLIIDIDATLVTAHSEKEKAAGTYKRTFGFHPLTAFIDHGSDGTGEPAAIMLRPGNAGANTAKDHIEITKTALRQLPTNKDRARGAKKILIRADGGGSAREYVSWLTDHGLSYSIGYDLHKHAGIHEVLDLISQADAWQAAVDADGDVREDAYVAELTDLLDISRDPAGMRVIARIEKAHPGAQTGLFDWEGNRVTAFITNSVTGQLADLELRHRRRARCEDRIRIGKDTGLANLPLQGFDQNRIWCAIVMLALDIIAWMQTLAFASNQARRWEPKRLRYRIFTIPAAIARHGRRSILHISDRSKWATLAETAILRLRGLNPRPG